MEQAILVDIDIANLCSRLNLSFKDKESLIETGRNILEIQREKIDDSLESYRDEHGELDASKIGLDWFPNIDADIFISHSHKDEADVLFLAGLIHSEFKKTCFVDSCVWNYCDNLIELINSQYNPKLDHQTCNYVSSHVHMMLSVALSKMISKTECLMFFKTPSSVSPEETIEKHTLSPWIYSELELARILLAEKNRKPLLETFSRRNLVVKYPVDVSDFLILDQTAADNWFSHEYNDGSALSELYKQLTPRRPVPGVRTGIYRPEDYLRRR